MDIALRDFKAFYGRNKGKIWLIVILAIFVFLALGCLLFPELFWDRFIYRYYWGPVEVDALESGPIIQSDGYVIDQGYTLISEITYGIILILALFGIYRLFSRLNIKIDLRFVLSVLPYFFLGGTLRVLEDAELYKEPYSYLFISPLIYFVIGGVIIAMILLLVPLENKESMPVKKRFLFGVLPFAVFDVIYLGIYFLNSEGANYLVHPGVPISFSIILISELFFDLKKKGAFDPYMAVFLFGLFLLVFSIFTITLWPSIEPWKTAYLEAHGRMDVAPQPLAGLLVIIISLGITFCTFAAARFLKNKNKVMAIYTDPINLLIIFGQMFDAAATFVGVDFFGYGEKHPIPRFFFESFGTSAVFLPIKFILAVVIIYIIDVSFKEELREHPLLKGLIKIIVIVLGLAPGMRDVLRTAMGV